MRGIARLWLLGALIAALIALGPGVAWATGLASSVGTENAVGDEDDGDDDGGDEADDDDADDDGDDAGGGMDRAFCGQVMQASTPVMRASTQAVRVNRKRVAAVRVTGPANKDSTVTVKLRRKGKLLASKSVKLNAGKSKLVKVKLSRKAFLKLRDKRQVKAIVTAGNAAAQPGSGACSIPGLLDFDFDASSGPLGENPTGTFFWESLPIHYEGQVTCLQVTGNRASVGGTITVSRDPRFVGRGLAFTVVDNSPGAPDLISFGPSLLPAGPPANTPGCGASTGAGGSVTGDIVVQDNIGGGGDDDEDDDDDEGDDEDDDD